MTISQTKMQSERDPSVDISPSIDNRDGSLTIIDEIASFIERFVFLKKKVHYRLIAMWVVATYFLPLFEYVGYLFAHSPEPQSGKSRLLEVLDLLVHNSSSILISPTEAVLFRTAADTTQLLDEVDSWGPKVNLRSVLNAGYKKGGTVTRMEQTNNSGYKAVKFLVFAARALAGIGTRILDQTTRDRTFMIEMVRQRKEERREKLNRKAKEHAKILKQRISKWAQAHRHEVEELYEQAGFPYLEDFQDRTIDIVQPLAAIAEVAYRDNGPTMQIRADLVEAVATTRKDQESLANEFPLLQEFTRLAESQNPLTGNVSELTQLCKVLPEPPHDFEVEAFVQKYGFERKSIRKDGGNPKYRYILPHEKLADLLSRYGSSNQPGKEEAENDEVTTA